jgi:hypothetical protein
MLAPRTTVEEGKAHTQISIDKLQRRMRTKPEYTDFMSGLLAAEKEKNISVPEILSNVPGLIVQRNNRHSPHRGNLLLD